MSLQIRLAENRTTFSPGDTLAGTVAWQLGEPPQSAELHLIWDTQGKGTAESTIVRTVTFAHPQAVETRPFEFALPDAPYSFSGQLISLIWALELEIQPGDHGERFEIVLAPGGREVLLPRI